MTDRLTNRQWLKLINKYMGLNGRATLDWKAVLGLEGGYGENKIKSIDDAMLPENEGTWPGIWFQSGQKDYSVYNRYDYIYSLLFGRQISAGTTKMVVDDLMNRSLWMHSFVLVDWGGSAFTAKDLLGSGAPLSRLYTVNFGGPQSDFARWLFRIETIEPKWFLKREDDEDHLFALQKSLADLPVVTVDVVWLFSEVLEHVKEPLRYWDELCDRFGIKSAYIANSFCTPAYGHHVPIIMDGKECYTVRIANKAWRKGMEERGYTLVKMKGWNSRLWHVRKE